MPKYTVVFVMPEQEAFPVRERFSWWKALCEYILPACDYYKIQCRAEEEEGLRCCARLGIEAGAERVKSGRTEVWCGQISERFVEELIVNPFDEERDCIKWSAISLFAGRFLIFSSKGNGAEVTLRKFDGQDMDFLQELAIKEGISFRCWEEGKSGETVELWQFINKKKEK